MADTIHELSNNSANIHVFETTKSTNKDGKSIDSGADADVARVLEKFTHESPV